MSAEPHPDAEPGDLRVVVAGAGHLGLRTARLLHDRGHAVVLIEADENRLEHVSDAYVASVIVGDAAKPSVLRQAQPARCDVVAALTDDEATNSAVCTATQRMADARTVMRTTSEPDDLYPEYVDATVFPESLGARAAVNEITGVGVRTSEDVSADLEIRVRRRRRGDEPPARVTSEGDVGAGGRTARRGATRICPTGPKEPP